MSSIGWFLLFGCVVVSTAADDCIFYGPFARSMLKLHSKHRKPLEEFLRRELNDYDVLVEGNVFDNVSTDPVFYVLLVLYEFGKPHIFLRLNADNGENITVEHYRYTNVSLYDKYGQCTKCSIDDVRSGNPKCRFP